MAKVLITGGAGYVGSTVAAALIDQTAHEIWVVDDLSTGHREQLEAVGVSHFIEAEVGDVDLLRPLFLAQKFDAVLHFAGVIAVSESVSQPKKYWDINFEQTRRLLDLMHETGVSRFVFSSTCAVFGVPSSLPISEDLPTRPQSPYGETKLAVEKELTRLASERGLSSIALRYFNACGAEARLRVGERHEPETHLIPCLIRAMLRGQRFSIFGTDYPTPDGTAIRDYVHVSDLAAAHLEALEKLLSEPNLGFLALNLGLGRGYSVQEVLESTQRLLGGRVRPGFEVARESRRPGDVPCLIADPRLAQENLQGWKAEHDLADILTSAVLWETKMQKQARRAVFLDRDGTINFDPGYIKDPEALNLLDGALDGMKRLQDAGFRLVVVTNQSGIGRGYFTEEDLKKVHARLDELLREGGVHVDYYSVCIHRPEDQCPCRKPLPKLLLDGALALGIDPSQSYMVGDKLLDLDAGRNAGCRASILVRTGWGEDSVTRLKDGQAAYVATNLGQACDWILEQGE